MTDHSPPRNAEGESDWCHTFISAKCLLGEHTGSNLPLFLQHSNTVARLIFAHLTDRFKTSCSPSQDNIFQYITKDAHFAVKSNVNPTATVKDAQPSALHFTDDSRPHHAAPHSYILLIIPAVSGFPNADSVIATRCSAVILP
jgi:hypothetical protein